MSKLAQSAATLGEFAERLTAVAKRVAVLQKRLKAMNSRIHANMTYLCALKNRMETLHFPKDDPLYLRTVAAYDATYELFMWSTCKNFWPGRK